MRLSLLIDGAPDIEVSGVTADSRAVRDGYLFAAIPGSKQNGAAFIADAILHGAAVILALRGTPLPSGASARLIESDNPRRDLAHIAARFYGRQPDRIVAVTGTSGKTSTVTFVQQLWELAGIEKSVSLGTLGVRGAGMAQSGALTTPDTVSLHAALADLAAAGITHLAMEASSHGLDQHRLDAVKIKAAGYTNLSRDHLDYHPTMEDYFLAKARLFSQVTKNGVCVLNADDPYFERLSALSAKAGNTIISYGEDGTDIKILSRRAEPSGQRLSLSVFGKKYEILLPLVGQFQVMNALCALGLVMTDEDRSGVFVPLLEKLRGVPGRLQLVPGHAEGAAVYVDYAHKPAAIEAVLNTLRPHTKGRLVCVFGCGGDRDAGKRPIMGRIAAGLADLVVVTDDNPRGENAAAIRSAIMEGAPDAVEIGDRRKAIEWAVDEIGSGDVLVIAGKGHEQGQIIGDRIEPFDDVAVAEEAMKNSSKKV